MANTTGKTTKEIREWYEQHHEAIEKFDKKNIDSYIFRDVAKAANKAVQVINKDDFKNYLENIGNNETRLRRMAWFLYYRSTIMYRVVHWYATMYDFRVRLVTPKYNIGSGEDITQVAEPYYSSLEFLDRINLQGNLVGPLINCFIQDVFYAIAYIDDYGMILYPLDPDACKITGAYSQGGYSFSVDMSTFKSRVKQETIEYLGEPLKSMWNEYDRTGVKWIPCPDEYAFALKFGVEDWEVVAPIFLGAFLELSSLEQLKDIADDANMLDMYKLVYYPLETRNNADTENEFRVSASVAYEYIRKLIDTALPGSVAGAITPGELKTIDFPKTVDSDVTSVQKTENQILATLGGGAVLSTSFISSNQAFLAWLKSETRFATSSIIPQVDGFANRMLYFQLKDKAATVKHFDVSVYTKQELAEQLLTSCQYSFSNRLAYNTCLGISERQTLIMEQVEKNLLKLPEEMNHPLASSFTSAGGEVGQGAPTKNVDDLTDSGERDQNR